MRLSATLQDCDVGNTSAERLTRPAFHRSIFLGRPAEVPRYRGGRTSRPVPLELVRQRGRRMPADNPFRFGRLARVLATVRNHSRGLKFLLLPPLGRHASPADTAAADFTVNHSQCARSGTRQGRDFEYYGWTRRQLSAVPGGKARSTLSFCYLRTSAARISSRFCRYSPRAISPRA